MSGFWGCTANGRHFTTCRSDKDFREHFHIGGKRVSRAVWHAELRLAKAADECPITAEDISTDGKPESERVAAILRAYL